MIYPRTERQARFISLANTLAAQFSGRAAEHDRQGTFPYENYADIRTAGLPKLVVPKIYGGWEANLLETVLTMEALAVGDGSTALSLTMHMQTLGAAADTEAWPEELFAQVCREVVKRGALVNATASEPELGSPTRGGLPKTLARPIFGNTIDPTEWEIEGRKSFASLSPVLDFFVIPAALKDGSGQIANFLVPSSEAVEIVESWDAMGMRATGSHDILIKNARIPAEYLISRSDPRVPDPTKAVANAWFALTISAVYLGVAQAALIAATHYAQERVPTALGKPIAELDTIQARLGQAQLLLTQAQAILYQTAGDWSEYPDRRHEISTAIIATKVTVTNNAVAAVDHCMRIAGGAGMTRDLPLERYYRDVRGGLSHPPSDDQALQILGRVALKRWPLKRKPN